MSSIRSVSRAFRRLLNSKVLSSCKRHLITHMSVTEVLRVPSLSPTSSKMPSSISGSMTAGGDGMRAGVVAVVRSKGRAVNTIPSQSGRLPGLDSRSGHAMSPPAPAAARRRSSQAAGAAVPVMCCSCLLFRFPGYLIDRRLPRRATRSSAWVSIR